MKRLHLVTLLFSLLTLPLAAQNIILEEDFETDGAGDRYTVSNEFFDGKDDYFGRVYGPTEEFGTDGSGNTIDVIGTGGSGSQNGMYGGFHGNYFVAGEDQDDDGGDGVDENSITFTLDISNASGLTFKGLFGAGNENDCGDNNYDATDYVKVFYSIDGGPEVEGLCFNADLECNIPGDTTNEPFHHDPNCDGDGDDGALMGNMLVEYSFPIPDGSSLTLRIESHMDAGNEEIAYDWIRVEAQTVTDPCAAEAGTLEGLIPVICLGDLVAVDLTGNNTDAAYTQVFLLADPDGNVTSIQTASPLIFAAPGTYTVYSYNYETAGGSNPDPVNISDINCMDNCCDLEAGATTVEVLPNIIGTFTALADLCIDAGVQSGLGSGSPVGGVYSGPGVTDDGNGMTYSFDPAAAGVGTHTITYTPAGLCESAASDEVEVFDLPTVSFTSSLTTITLNAGVQTGLTGGSPDGGVYSGPGVTDDGNGMTFSFDPVAAGIGVQTVTYAFTDANGCSASATAIIEVTDIPTLAGDQCSDAFDINALFGQTFNEAQTSELYDNTNYTTDFTDPTEGWECFGEPDGGGTAPSLERTIWYTFIGDGNTYFIQTVACNATDYIDDGDTQMAIYSGTDCDNLTPVICNEDGANALEFEAQVELMTEDGTMYFMMIDGFGPDFAAEGEYCVEVTNLTEPVSTTEVSEPIIQLFPNPTTGVVTFRGGQPDRIRLWDATGALMLVRERPGTELNLEAYPAGMYLLEMELGEKQFTQKIIVE